ncbi:MAG: DUF47 family protein [Candidatus Heimdallarchaeota archaeon]|nr:DUF47 family protein [Candidatus Heimdallarchaeota archaeon]
MTNREIAAFRERGKVVEILRAILSNLKEEVGLIISNIQGETETTDEVLLDLSNRQDNYSNMINEMVIDGLFLSIGRIDLQLVNNSLDEVVDNLQAYIHRFRLLSLPEWIQNHNIKMLEIIREILVKLDRWIDIDDELQPELALINTLENEADRIHLAFLKRLYKEELDLKLMQYAELLDEKLESTIDHLEALSRRFYVIIRQYRHHLQSPPKYM